MNDGWRKIFRLKGNFRWQTGKISEKQAEARRLSADIWVSFPCTTLVLGFTLRNKGIFIEISWSKKTISEVKSWAHIFSRYIFLDLLFFITEYISAFKNNHEKTVGSCGSIGRKKCMVNFSPVKHDLSGIQKYRRRWVSENSSTVRIQIVQICWVRNKFITDKSVLWILLLSFLPIKIQEPTRQFWRRSNGEINEGNPVMLTISATRYDILYKMSNNL